MRTLFHQFDLRITNWIASWPQSYQPFFHFITSLGDPVITISIGIVVALAGFAQNNIRLLLSGASIWITLGAGSILKLLFNRARPLTEYAANMRIDTFSFPSGHTSGSTIAYGLLAYLAWHLLPSPWSYIVVAICVVLIIAIGVSRIYLGAHFPTDVVAGWLLGGLALVTIIYILRPL
jgi:undecaprenyl-diphosphatase